MQQVLVPRLEALDLEGAEGADSTSKACLRGQDLPHPVQSDESSECHHRSCRSLLCQAWNGFAWVHFLLSWEDSVLGCQKVQVLACHRPLVSHRHMRRWSRVLPCHLGADISRRRRVLYQFQKGDLDLGRRGVDPWPLHVSFEVSTRMISDEGLLSPILCLSKRHDLPTNFPFPSLVSF